MIASLPPGPSGGQARRARGHRHRVAGRVAGWPPSPQSPLTVRGLRPMGQGPRAGRTLHGCLIATTLTTVVAEARRRPWPTASPAALDEQADRRGGRHAPAPAEGAGEQVLELMPDSGAHRPAPARRDGLEACRTVHALALGHRPRGAGPSRGRRPGLRGPVRGRGCLRGRRHAADQLGDAVRGATRGECVLPGADRRPGARRPRRIAAASPPHAAVGRAALAHRHRARGAHPAWPTARRP